MKNYLILGGLIVVAGILINYSFGGFEPIESTMISNPQTIIYGRFYEGSHSSDLLEKQLADLRKILKDPGNKGTLTIVNYINATLEQKGMVKQFLGIEGKKNLPYQAYELDSLVIDAYDGIQIIIPMKPLVMPSPEKLKKLAEKTAEIKGNKLRGYSIEQYKNQTLVINFPLK